MKKISFILLFFLTLGISVHAQELNANVTVNSDRIQSTNKAIFTSMEQALSQFVNGQKWSATTFSNVEKIDCSFAITILEQPSENSFRAELFVQARRPVYNSSYTTTLLNWRDTNFEFEYTENASIELNETNIDSNLVAVISFYCNLILALDFDSFSPLGGSVFYRQALTIATQAQSNMSWAGWSSFDDTKSRTSIINTYNNESLKPFRQFWYTYHRKAMDEMTANADRSRTSILNALPILKEVRNIRDSEIIIQMFADCKLDEIVTIAGKATSEEKKETYDLLRSIYPTMGDQLEPLKK